MVIFKWKSGCRNGNAVNLLSRFGTYASPQNAESVEWINWKTLVNHHRKRESAKVHLDSCDISRKLMNSMIGNERPDWCRRKNKCWATKNAAADSQCGKCQLAAGFRVLSSPLRSRRRSDPWSRCFRSRWRCINSPQSPRSSGSRMWIWKRPSISVLMRDYYRKNGSS